MDITDFHPNQMSKTDLQRIKDFETKFAALAADIIVSIGSCAHRTAALRKLLEAKMTVIHAISHP